MSRMCVSRLIVLVSRCERSPIPVNVGVYTSWASLAARMIGATNCQHHPPCHAPCTSTNLAILYPQLNLELPVPQFPQPTEYHESFRCSDQRTARIGGRGLV